MAEFAPAAAITLVHEGGFYHNPATGEYANLGITLATLRSLGILKTTGPALQSDIDFVKSLTEDEAKDIYRLEYWDKLNLDHLNSQDVANKVFDLAVNMGVVTAARFLQAACGVPVDGIVGAQTIGAANAGDQVALLGSIRARAANRYRDIAAENPNLAPNLPGWLARLNS